MPTNALARTSTALVGTVQPGKIVKWAVSDRVENDRQPLREVNHDVVERYAAEISDGAKFPRPKVFFLNDGKTRIFADGWHTILAYREAEAHDLIDVERYDGATWADVMAACFLLNNDARALPLSRNDQQFLICEFSKQEKWLHASSPMIQKALGLRSKTTVERYRFRPEQEKGAPVLRQGRDGKQRALPPSKPKALQEKAGAPPPRHESEPTAQPPKEPLLDEEGNPIDPNESYTEGEVMRVLHLFAALIEVPLSEMVDAASDEFANRKVQAGRFITKEMNSLDEKTHWRSKSGKASLCWCNPPYKLGGTGLIEAFIDKADEEFERGNVTDQLFLIPLRVTDPGWSKLVRDYDVMLPRHRLEFWDRSGRSQQKTVAGIIPMEVVIAYRGENHAEFAATFGQFGSLLPVGAVLHSEEKFLNSKRLAQAKEALEYRIARTKALANGNPDADVLVKIQQDEIERLEAWFGPDMKRAVEAARESLNSVKTWQEERTAIEEQRRMRGDPKRRKRGEGFSDWRKRLSAERKAKVDEDERIGRKLLLTDQEASAQSEAFVANVEKANAKLEAEGWTPKGRRKTRKAKG